MVLATPLFARPSLRPLTLLLGSFALAQCATINDHVPENEETAFATDGVISRYHALLNTPFSHPLGGDGYIIGIEKSPRDKIGFVGAGADINRLQEPQRLPSSGDPRDLAQQVASFDAATNDPKVMFVSHVLRYAQKEENATLDTELMYSAYSKSAFGEHKAPPPTQAYDAGWTALDDLEDQILNDVQTARDAGHPFTHVMFLSMGWNNDQFEALDRYNAIRQHSTRAAKEQGKTFKPLVIGLTWPSVWGGTSVLDVANRALHLGSYPVKAVDADEIGYGIANHILNAMLPRIENAMRPRNSSETGLRTIVVGHSMGARILTRAYYSADLLTAPEQRTGPAPIVIGLQAAFSANRFRSSFRLIPPVRWVFTGEGGPYQDHAAPGGILALTWAKGDTANPVARFTTGAAHVGGGIGERRIRKTPSLSAKMETYAVPSAENLGPINVPCQAVKENGKVLYIDASEIIESHGDIRNPKVGDLVWTLIDCLDD